MDDQLKKILGPILALSILVSGGVGFVAGKSAAGLPLGSSTNTVGVNTNAAGQEEQVVSVAERSAPAVVSIIVTKDLPVIEQYEFDPFSDFPFFVIPRELGTERREIGGGSGFIVASDGLIMTNTHVVSDTGAEYTVLTNDGEKIPARVLARHPVLDLAILKIDKKNLPVLQLGNSDDLKPGATAIAIGNALGEFRNTVSTGVISGLRRNIVAGSERGSVEELEDVIQTDAAINPGNSGGPLLNLKGEVVGINVAVAVNAQSIGFAIPVNQSKRMIEEVRATGKFSVAFLGVRYVMLNDALQRANNLQVNYGAYVSSDGAGQPAVTPGSPAATAGLRDRDIILELDGAKLDEKNTLAEVIANKKPGDEVTLKVLRGSETITVRVKLGER